MQFVEDPAGRFLHKPLVAEFRVRGPPENEAFTFALINVQTNPARAAAELDLLATVFRTMRKTVLSNGQLKTTSSCWATWRPITNTWACWAECPI